MKQIALDLGLAPVPTLSSFFIGPNEAALRLLEHWVNEKSTSATLSPVPVYLWGDSGSGKTHLLKSVQASLCERGATVGWLDVTLQNPPEFDERWAAVLMDDVHFYSPEQQHTAFNWFVNAQTHPCRVLSAGALPPADLTLRDDLRTRLGWGHIFHLHVPNELQRREILHQAADARGVSLSDDVIDFMLNRFSRDLGSLMELLDMLDGYALQTKRGVTIPLIKSMLENS